MNERKLAIVIVAYNAPNLLVKQLECIKKFCKDDDYDIIVVDNSTDKEASEAIKYHSQGNIYLRTESAFANDSLSHSFAANLSYRKFQAEYGFFFYIDHDCFPVKPFWVRDILKNADMAGMSQSKNGIMYFWPGCVMWRNTEKLKLLIDFSISRELQLDTGGMLYNAIQACDEERLLFFSERYAENVHHPKPPYNFYSLINDGMFMHFVNGSGWNSQEETKEENQQRMNSLFNILNDKIS